MLSVIGEVDRDVVRASRYFASARFCPPSEVLDWAYYCRRQLTAASFGVRRQHKHHVQRLATTPITELRVFWSVILTRIIKCANTRDNGESHSEGNDKELDRF